MMTELENDKTDKTTPCTMRYRSLCQCAAKIPFTPANPSLTRSYFTRADGVSAELHVGPCVFVTRLRTIGISADFLAQPVLFPSVR